MWRPRIDKCQTCGAPFVRRLPTSRWCGACVRARQRRRNRQWMQRHRNSECTVPDEAVAVLAIEDPRQRHEAIMEMVK